MVEKSDSNCHETEENMAKRLISLFSRGWAQNLLPTSSTKVIILDMYLVYVFDTLFMGLTMIIGWYRCNLWFFQCGI